jgi:hypothetical protein
MKQILKNNAVSPLANAVLIADTTIEVVDGSRFPATGNFTVIIGDDSGNAELMLCTARTGNVLTVTRGVEDRDPASNHIAGRDVAAVLTVGTQEAWSRQNAPLWESDRPPFGLYDASGNIVDSSYFTIINQNSSVITDHAGTLGIVKPVNAGNSQNCTWLLEPAVSPPFTRVLAFQFCGGRTQTIEHSEFGLVIQESATGKAILFNKDYNAGTKLGAYRFTDAVTHSGANSIAAANFDFPEIVWLKIEVTTTNVIYYYSSDGITWMLVASELDTAFMAGTIDRVGIGFNCLQTNFPLHARVFHYGAE